ncbi:hypothetical protein BP5796_00527 [Coleophoma crateriformis]|uniref:Uncharacterized protein n=1 Tax=Coleophoma crateriformis TaxID=565419 RepID=A0A3D8T8B8_9HELO|nr:hypothetical protein BP5796_00527 [Coleophoma crateriformis]
MARNRKQNDPAKIKLVQPDRSGPDPTQETLLDMAQKRGLLDVPDEEEAAAEEPLVGRLGDAMLWSLSLTMLHFTLDVLVQHQYAVEIKWPSMITRAFQAFPSTF